MKKIFLGRTGRGKTSKVLEALVGLNISDTSRVLLLVEPSEESKYREVVPEGSMHSVDSLFDGLYVSLRKGDARGKTFDTLVVDIRLDKNIISSLVGLDVFKNVLFTSQTKNNVLVAVGVLLDNMGEFTVEVLS